MKRLAQIAALATLGGIVVLGIYGCGSGPGGASPGGGESLSGAIVTDGSSTVSPIMAAVAEEFGKLHSEVKPTVATSGTGGGFKKFCNGEIDISNASRPIKPEEIEACKAGGVEFIELPIAFDGLSVVVNPQNNWVESITVEELKKIWEPGSKVDSWDDVRAGWPSQKITLFGAGTDSGTFDYFTEAIVGKSKASRSDYQASEDDNVLVQGVAGDKGALGYFGYAYFEQNQSKLKLLGINGVQPTPETIANGTYTPLSRPLLIYVNKASVAKPQVRAMVEYLMGEGRELIREEGYVPLPDSAYEAALKRLDGGVTGTVFSGAQPGMSIDDLLKREGASG